MSTPVDAAGIRAQYEALRREVFGARSDGVPSHGLALFLLRGMSAWYAALTAGAGTARLAPTGGTS